MTTSQAPVTRRFLYRHNHLPITAPGNPINFAYLHK